MESTATIAKYPSDNHHAKAQPGERSTRSSNQSLIPVPDSIAFPGALCPSSTESKPLMQRALGRVVLRVLAPLRPPPVWTSARGIYSCSVLISQRLRGRTCS